MSSFPETATYVNQDQPSGTGLQRKQASGSAKKNQVLRANSKQREKLKMNDVKLEDFRGFTHLVSIVTSDRGAFVVLMISTGE